jgi:hypothetical protein
MAPGLAFLSKKSFHTSNLVNVEKVWLAEQKLEQEKKRLIELQKQLEEERQIQELRQLQAAHGGETAKFIDSALDWMYAGPAAGEAEKNKKEAEEFLLGKAFRAKEGKTVDLALAGLSIFSCLFVLFTLVAAHSEFNHNERPKYLGK